MGLLTLPSAPATGQPKAGLLNNAPSTPAPKAGILARTDGGAPGTIQNLDDFKTHIAKVESGGKYDAIGVATSSGARALGKYQVMETNLPSWGQEYLGRPVSKQEFLSSPQLQEELATKRFDQLYKKYGNWDDVASVWFTGRPRAVAGGTVADATGTTNDDYIRKVTGGGTVANSTPAVLASVVKPAPAPVAAPAPVQKPGFLGLLKDTVLGLPQAAKEVGSDIIHGVASAGQKSLQAYSVIAPALHKLGSIPLDAIDPSGKAARDQARQDITLTPQGQFQQDLYGTSQTITPQSVAAQVGIKPDSSFAAPAGLALGTLDLIPGGNATKQEAVTLLKGINSAREAEGVIGRILGVASSVAKKYAPEAARLTDEASIGQLIDKVVAESQDAVQVAKRTGTGISNLFRGAKGAEDTTRVIGEVTNDATQIVQNHLNEAKMVTANLPPAEIEQLGGIQTLIGRTKTNIVDGLKAEGKADISNAVNAIDTSKMRTLDEFENAVHSAVNQPGLTARVERLAQEGRTDLQLEPEVPARQVAETAQKADDVGISLLDDATNLSKIKGVNVNTLNISDEGKAVVSRVAEEVKPLMEAKIGTKLTNQEVVNLAQETGKVLNRTIGKEQTADWAAQMLRARQRLASASESGTIDRDYIDNLLAIKTHGTDIARKLQSLSIGADARTVTQKELVLDAVLKVTDNVDEILKAAEGVDFNDLTQATRFYRKFISPKAMEWVDLIRYNSMLSSPKTHIINALGGNLPNSLLIAPIQKAIQGGLDFMKAGFTGSERKYFVGEAGVYVKDYFKGLGDASRRFGQVLAGKRGFTDVDLRTMPVAVDGVKGAIAKTLEFPMKLLEASDQFFTALVESAEMGTYKYKVAKGVTGLGNLETKAADSAAYRLFRQDPGTVPQGVLLEAVDTLTTVINHARNSKDPIISTIAKFTLPFVRTPINIFKQGIEYSPLGFANLIGAKKGGRFGLGLAGDVNEQVAKAVLGSAVFAGAATMLSSNRLTWAEPTGDQRNTFRAAGMQPYSMKIGNTWYSYQKLPPAIAFPFAMVAAIDDSLKTKTIDESTADVVLGFIGNYANFLKDQSYVKSIGDIVNGEYGLEGIAGNYIQQLVPFRALGGWLARLTDPTQRKIDRDQGFIGQQVQQLMLNIPGLSHDIPARTDAQGNPIPQANPIGNAFSPVGFTEQDSQKAADYGEIEDIRVRNRNSNALNDHKTMEAEEIAKKAVAMPKEDALKYLEETVGDDVQLRDKVKAEIKSLKVDLEPKEKAIKSLNVADGTRARYIVEQVNKLGTREEKIQYLENLSAKGVISSDVKSQIKELMSQQPAPTPAPAGGVSMNGSNASDVLAFLTGANRAEAAEPGAPAQAHITAGDVIKEIPGEALKLGMGAAKFAAESTAKGLGLLAHGAQAAVRGATSAEPEVAPNPSPAPANPVQNLVNTPVPTTPDQGREVVVRGAPIDKATFDSVVRPVIYGEVSNRTPDKQELEARVILNTIVNRIAERQKLGKATDMNKTVTEPNQYQAYNGEQYKKFVAGNLKGVEKQKADTVNAILDQLWQQMQSGEFTDNTNGAYFYIHNKNGTIAYDDKRPLYKK